MKISDLPGKAKSRETLKINHLFFLRQTKIGRAQEKNSFRLLCSRDESCCTSAVPLQLV